MEEEDSKDAGTIAVGANVERYFENLSEWYCGQVTAVRVDEDDDDVVNDVRNVDPQSALYRVHYPADASKTYPDSDREDLSYEEALQAVQDYQQRHPNGNKRSPSATTTTTKRKNSNVHKNDFGERKRSPLRQRNDSLDIVNDNPEDAIVKKSATSKGANQKSPARKKQKNVKENIGSTASPLSKSSSSSEEETTAVNKRQHRLAPSPTQVSPRRRHSTTTRCSYKDATSSSSSEDDDEEDEEPIVSSSRPYNTKRSRPSRASASKPKKVILEDSESEVELDESSEDELELDDDDVSSEEELMSVTMSDDDDLLTAPTATDKRAATSNRGRTTNTKKSAAAPNKRRKTAKTIGPRAHNSDHDSAEQIELEIANSHAATTNGGSSGNRGRRKSQTTTDDDTTLADPSRNFVKRPYTAGDNLPIISDPQEMMVDMVSKLDWDDMLLPLIRTLRTRTLKVATMCSGTEAPILALDMLQTAIRDRLREEQDDTDNDSNSSACSIPLSEIDNVFRIEHVFSCEIEPFKQAYIERNFQPPLLFRDIRELGQDQAYTAYGSLRDVPNTPGTVDMLIAGTSCVDYSNLNAKKKTIDQKGESGQTFFGMIKWIEKAQPTIVIIENVSGAPWETKLELFRERGYHATFSRLDTKDYYIPQTRQRGYLFAVRANPAGASTSPKKSKTSNLKLDKRPDQWLATLKSLKRPASAALDAFMLANDDPRVLRGRARLTAESRSSAGESRAGRVDWTKCETLHQQSRSLENLGGKRPLTNWSESSNTAMPSFAWNEWANAQVNRIHDLMDINTLRLAKCGIDGSYKTMVWNLSQNVGRDTMGKLGLSQCITPTGVPYVANRGGVLVGEELLMLQGIPAEDLLLTKESEANLKDFAGNGMSTTVVGAVMLCALLHAHDAVALVEDNSENVGAIVHSLVPKPLLPSSQVSILVTGAKESETHNIDLGAGTFVGLDEWGKFLRDAQSSAKKCVSEGDTECVQATDLVVCQDCGLSARREHAVPPRKFEEHSFVPYSSKMGSSRANIEQFRRALLNLLPMRVQLRKFQLKGLEKPNILDKKTWEAWKTVVSEKTNETDEHTTLFFKEIQRSHIWTAVFASSCGTRLETRISGTGVTWFFFVDPPAEQGTLRDTLLQPVARMKVTFASGDRGSFTLLNGIWEICHPEARQITVKIENDGDTTISSWRSRLGLTGEYETEHQFEKVRVTLDTTDSKLKSRVDGTYESLPKCGGACGSLRRKVGSNGAADMYMFLESGRKTLPDSDAYIFSHLCHRTRYREYRETELIMDSKFDPILKGEPTTEGYSTEVNAVTPGTWIACKDIVLDQLCKEGDSLCATLVCPTQSSLAKQAVALSSWQNAPQITGCNIPIMNPSSALAKLYRNMGVTSCDVNLLKSSRVFRDLAFILSRLTIPKALQTCDTDGWVALGIKSDQVCQACSPRKPAVGWHAVSKGNSIKFLPVEDGQEAAVHERALKERPSPWLLRLEGNGAQLKSFQLAFNAVSLTQRALGCFPSVSFARERLLHFAKDPEQADCHQDWRILPHIEKNQSTFATLSFRSNKLDSQADQPPRFNRYPLRKEQLRSLAWMLAQERSESPFWEEEVSESILPNLNWRAEGRARRPVLVKGGIIADEVGYGKTAITLGLIDSSDGVNGSAEPPTTCSDAFIQTKATLVIVPQHLMGQWPDEVKKFLGGRTKLVVLKNMQSFNTTTIADIISADIVVASFQVLGNEMYYQHLARLCGIRQSSMPAGNKGGRHFEAVYSECLNSLKGRVAQIVGNTRDVFASIQDDTKRSIDAKEDAICLDGKKTVYKNDGNKAKAKQKNASKGQKDPWGLSTPAVKTVYKKMKCPSLEMFHWKRIVVDEFTYLDSVKRERVLAFILGIRSSFRWFLSGTPNHANFNDIQTLATLLGVHLGVEESLPGVKMSKRGQSVSDATGLESLSLFLELRSMQWHERRHALAQQFLDRFVRQNQAEHDEIPWEEHELHVDLPPVERAIYLELETHLRSLEMNSKNAQRSKKKSTGDRDSRMQLILQESASAEEALLKCCCHFNMTSSIVDSSAIETIQDIIAHRREQKDELVDSLVALVADAFRMQHRILLEQPDWLLETTSEKGEMMSALKQYLHAVDNNQSVTHGADDEVHATITTIVKDAETDFRNNPCELVEDFEELCDADAKGEVKNYRERLFPMKLKLRDHMHNVRSTGKELCGRIRSLRYIEWIHKFQTSTTTFDCSHCQRKGIETKEAGVLSSCGHIGCLDCLKKSALEEKCIKAPACQARVSSAHVVQSSFFGQHIIDKSGGKFGKKLTTIVDKVQAIIKLGDRIIIFCQFDDLTAKIVEALDTSKIKALQVKGSVTQQIKSLAVFQKEKPGKDDPRVLLLKMDDEQSAGLNLTMLNHAIFVHPLLADSQQEYVAYETQAIGRIRRFGQSKKVHIHRFLVNDTIDTEIYNERTEETTDKTTG